MSNLEAMLVELKGAAWTTRVLGTVHVDPTLHFPVRERAARYEIAQALNLILFEDLIRRVPAAAEYVSEVVAADRKVNFDHGALRTVLAPSGALPAGEASIIRVLRPLGYCLSGTYPLDRLGMTGRAWKQIDFPEHIAQFFVSELHPERFSLSFQLTVSRVVGASADPLPVAAVGLLEKLARDMDLLRAEATSLLRALETCFGRHHGTFAWADYEALLSESPEMAWIATEGNTFNHATDRVDDVAEVAAAQRRAGRPIKDRVEVSMSGRVRQTAFRATTVARTFMDALGRPMVRDVPGSFYEFISRDIVREPGRPDKLDLQFDTGNATGIFGMTTAVDR
jgi:hypothetical protein